MILPIALERLGAAADRGSCAPEPSGEMRDGGLRATRADSTVALAIPSARWEGLGDTPGR